MLFSYTYLLRVCVSMRVCVSVRVRVVKMWPHTPSLHFTGMRLNDYKTRGPQHKLNHQTMARGQTAIKLKIYGRCSGIREVRPTNHIKYGCEKLTKYTTCTLWHRHKRTQTKCLRWLLSGLMSH